MRLSESPHYPWKQRIGDSPARPPDSANRFQLRLQLGGFLGISRGDVGLFSGILGKIEELSGGLVAEFRVGCLAPLRALTRGNELPVAGPDGELAGMLDDLVASLLRLA